MHRHRREEIDIDRNRNDDDDNFLTLENKQENLKIDL